MVKKAPKKRSKLDIEISRLQKNARNKLYRLRQKGAINANIAAAFNPVRPAHELESMSAIEKRQYASKLKEFNRRETAYTFDRSAEVVIQAGGSIIKSAELWEKRIQEAELNIIRQENAAKLAKIREQVLEAIPDSQVRNLDFVETPFEYAIDDGRFSAIKPVIRTEDFKPGAKTTYEMQKARLQSAFDERRLSTYKKAIINKLQDNDISENVIKRLANLSLNELAYLHYYTDFSVLAETWQYQETYEEGYRSPSGGESSAAEAGISELLRFLGK